MSDIVKLLKSLTGGMAAAITAAGASPFTIIAKEMTLEAFGNYVQAQMSKAATDEPSTAACRMQALITTAATVEHAFKGDAEKAWIPVVDDSGLSASAADSIGKATAAAEALAAKGKKGESESEADKDKPKAKAKDDSADDVDKNDDGGWSGSDLNDDADLKEILQNQK